MDNPAFHGESGASGGASGGSDATADVTSDATSDATSTVGSGSDGETTSTSAATTSTQTSEPTTDPTTGPITTATSITTTESTGMTGMTGMSGSTTDPVTTGDTDSTTDTGTVECLFPKTIVISGNNMTQDAFFTRGGLNETCVFPDADQNQAGDCAHRNYGATPSMALFSVKEPIESMYALRFEVAGALQEIEQSSGVVLEARLLLYLSGASDDVLLGLGALKADKVWKAGVGKGNVAKAGECSYATRQTGVPGAEWTGADGPRGASVPFATYQLSSNGKYDGYVVVATLDKDTWVATNALVNGIAIFLDPEVALGTVTPILYAVEGGGGKEPRIEIDYCPG